jgi:Ring finger domain
MRGTDSGTWHYFVPVTDTIAGTCKFCDSGIDTSTDFYSIARRVRHSVESEQSFNACRGCCCRRASRIHHPYKRQCAADAESVSIIPTNQSTRYSLSATMSIEATLLTLANLLPDEQCALSRINYDAQYYAQLHDTLDRYLTVFASIWELSRKGQDKIVPAFVNLLRLPMEYVLIAEGTTLLRVVGIIRQDLQPNASDAPRMSRAQKTGAAFLVAYYLCQRQWSCLGHDARLVIRLREELPKVLCRRTKLPKLRIASEPKDSNMQLGLVEARDQCRAVFRGWVRELKLSTTKQLVRGLAIASENGSPTMRRLHDIVLLHYDRPIEQMLASPELDYDLNLLLIHSGQTFGQHGDLVEWLRACLEGSSPKGIPDECSICLDRMASPFNQKVPSTIVQPKLVFKNLGCGHAFHLACVRRWVLGGNPSCPLCRQPISYTSINKL